MLPLARAHRVALDELVDTPETGDPRVRARPLVRQGRTYVPLTRRPGGLRAFKIVLPPQPEAPPDLRTHEGHEFDTRTPHWVANPGSAPTAALAILGPQGERVNLRE